MIATLRVSPVQEIGRASSITSMDTVLVNSIVKGSGWSLLAPTPKRCGYLGVSTSLMISIYSGC